MRERTAVGRQALREWATKITPKKLSCTRLTWGLRGLCQGHISDLGQCVDPRVKHEDNKESLEFIDSSILERRQFISNKAVVINLYFLVNILLNINAVSDESMILAFFAKNIGI
jgi:hypothetical protein